MLQVLDITKPVKEIILDKFNARAGLSIEYDHVVLGAVTAITAVDSQDNTSIQIVPTLLAPHLNTFTLLYNRMELIEIFSAPYLFVPSNGYTTLYELLADINQVVGLNLSVDDVDDAPVVTATSNTVNIKANATSVLYKGEVELVLDTGLNVPASTVESSSTLFIVSSNSSGMDSISAHAFDGYKSTAFKFLRNVSLVVQCKINHIFSCEGDLLVISGVFQMVAPTLPFISSALTYHTLTMHRDGTLVSAREEVSLLDSVSKNNISVDAVNKTYYVADTQNLLGGTKQCYRLFQNGTLDTSFDSSLIVAGVVKVVAAPNGFYAISFDGNNIYKINKHLVNGTLDPAFSTVTIQTVTSVSDLDAVYTFDEFGNEVLHVYMNNPYNTVNKAPTFTATTITGIPSVKPNDFFSPIFSIHEHGSILKKSSTLSKLNNNGPFQNGTVVNTLVKTLRNNVALYSLEYFGTLKSPTITPLLFGDDKEYALGIAPMDKVFNVINPPKIYQTLNGHETYAVIKYINSDTDVTCTGVVSFDAEQTLSGLVVQETSGNLQIVDLAILR